MASVFQRGWRSLRSLLTNVYFWAGLAVLALLIAVSYLFLNHLVMPNYTRYDVAVTIPDVINLPHEEAVQILEAKELRVDVEKQRFNPNLPRDVVVEQSPHRNAQVKPGRRVRLTINSGTTPRVTIPSLEGMSLREAENRLIAAGLRLQDARPDSIPSPYPNTVTRQQPAAGDSLQEGSGVVVWYSTGLGEQLVAVPDVTGLSVREAQQILLDRKLRSVVVGTGEDAEEEPVVARQSRDPGTSVREGFEIRLFVEPEAETPLEAEEQL